MSQKGLAPIFIILLIALAVSGFFIYRKQTKVPIVSQPVAQPSPSPVTSPTATNSAETANPDLIGANWKIYTNTNFKFQVNYPNGWEYQEVSAGDPLHLYFYPKHTQDLPQRNSGDTRAPIQLLIINNYPAYSFNSLCKDMPKDNPCMGLNDPVDLIVAGVPAKKRQLKSYPEIVDLIKNDYIFSMRSDKLDFNNLNYPYHKLYVLPSKELQNIFDQMLSTLKFTN